MRGNTKPKLLRFSKQALVLAVFLTALILQSVPSSVYAAATLLNRRDRMSSSNTSAITTHDISFTITDFATPVGSILIEFCENDPLPGTSCTAPNGFNATSTVLQDQSGETGFTIHPNSNSNRIILTRVPVLVVNSDVNYVFSNITNPADVGTFYIRLYTFATTDASGSDIESGGIALAVNNLFNVSAEVPPFLRFCAGITINDFDCASATSFLIDIGEFSSTETKSATSQMVAATNAASGLSISLSGTTLTSGNNVVSPLSSQSPSIIGTSQFGINLRLNGSPAVGADPVGPGIATATPAYNNPNQFRFNQGDVVASSNGPNDHRKFTVSYITNISADQSPGVYATTITFICLANF